MTEARPNPSNTSIRLLATSICATEGCGEPITKYKNSWYHNSTASSFCIVGDEKNFVSAKPVAECRKDVDSCVCASDEDCQATSGR